MKQTMKSLMGLSLAMVLAGVQAQASYGLVKPKKPAVEVKYKAQCGMIYSAADAKKNHYICPMDHKPLTKMAGSKSGHKKSM